MKIKSKITIDDNYTNRNALLILPGCPVKYQGTIVGKCISVETTDGSRDIVIEYEISDEQFVGQITDNFIFTMDMNKREVMISRPDAMPELSTVNKPFKQARIKIILSLVYDFMQVPYAMSMMNLKKSNYTTFDISRGPQIIAMNLALKDFEDYDAILLTEWDHDFEPDALEKLWNMNVPIASAMFKSRKGDHNWLLIDESGKENKYVNPKSMTEPFSMDCTGLGFMLIRREVLEKIGRPIFKPFSELHNNIDRQLCRDIRSAGFDVTVNPQVRLGHYCTDRVY